MGKLKDILDGKDHWELAERVMGFTVVPGKAVRSPLRKDDHKPSFNVFKGKDGKVRWKDFAAEGGDIYSLAMHWYQCSFPEALKKLAVLAGVNEGDIPVPPESTVNLALRAFKNVSRTRVTYSYRHFNERDKLFWGRYGITQALMRHMNTFPCETFAILREDGTQTLFQNTEGDPMYVYSFGERAKLYRPLHMDRQYRYIGNTSRDDVFGLRQLKADPGKYKHTVIAGGQKDAMTSMANLRVHGIAFNSENMIIPEKVMYDIMLTTPGETFIMYDADATGLDQMDKNLQRFPTLKPIWISQHTSGKDISDVVAHREWEGLRRVHDQIHGT